MRIIGGKYKGRIITANKKFSSRPTTDQAKEALFNILENRYDLSGMKILDLFSGTGSIGYEFVSRGASEVIFVEKDFRGVRHIRETFKKLEIANAQAICVDAFKFLKGCRQKFDIVFADPPFDAPYIVEIPKSVFDAEILKEDGLFILEHPKSYNFSGLPFFTELRKYGKVNFSFFSK